MTSLGLRLHSDWGYIRLKLRSSWGSAQDEAPLGLRFPSGWSSTRVEASHGLRLHLGWEFHNVEVFLFVSSISYCHVIFDFQESSSSSICIFDDLSSFEKKLVQEYISSLSCSGWPIYSNLETPNVSENLYLFTYTNNFSPLLGGSNFGFPASNRFFPGQ